MKKIASIAIVAAAILTGCNGDKLREAEAQNQQLKGDLSETLATQDSLLVLVNDISDGMAQIKRPRKIISTPGGLGAESSSRKEQIRNDMIAIQQALQERRERLAELEEKLTKTGGENSTLKRTISNLKAQIADQTTEIATLTNQLASANIKIEELSSTVSTLNTQVDSLQHRCSQRARTPKTPLRPRLTKPLQSSTPAIMPLATTRNSKSATYSRQASSARPRL